MVRDFADICYHSYPLYLKELRESPSTNELQPLRYCFTDTLNENPFRSAILMLQTLHQSKIIKLALDLVSNTCS